MFKFFPLLMMFSINALASDWSNPLTKDLFTDKLYKLAGTESRQGNGVLLLSCDVTEGVIQASVVIKKIPQVLISKKQDVIVKYRVGSKEFSQNIWSMSGFPTAVVEVPPQNISGFLIDLLGGIELIVTIDSDHGRYLFDSFSLLGVTDSMRGVFDYCGVSSKKLDISKAISKNDNDTDLVFYLDRYSELDPYLEKKEIVNTADSDLINRALGIESIGNRPPINRENLVFEPPNSSENGPWLLRIATFKNSKNASRLTEKLTQEGYPAHFITENDLYKVSVGPEIRYSVIESFRDEIERRFSLKGVVVKYSGD